MNKRISLTSDDIEIIIAALEHLHQSSIVNESVYRKYGLASRQRMEQIKFKLHTPSRKED